MRAIFVASVERRGRDGALVISFEGEGFLKHQVRRMVGAAVAVGAARLALGELRSALREARVCVVCVMMSRGASRPTRVGVRVVVNPDSLTEVPRSRLVVLES